MAYNNRGATLCERGELDKAITDYNRSIQIDPRLAVAYLNRGLVLLIQGKTTEAERDFDQCIKLDSDLRTVLAKRISEINRRR